MILVTGGAGYIGSHTCVELLNAGKEVVVSRQLLQQQPNRRSNVSDRSAESRLTVVEGDIRDQAVVEKVLNDFGCTAVIHFAGLKSVFDSVTSPLDYYDNNVVGTHRLLRAMQASGVKRIIFSSSATVYGDPKFLPYTEDHPLNPVNPYGQTNCCRGDAARPIRQRPNLEHRHTSLLQSHRCA